MEEVFGSFWRDVLGDSDDEDDEDESYVRIRRPSRDDARAVPVSAPGSDELSDITRKSFRGVVAASEAREGTTGGTEVDVLYRRRDGTAASARVRAEDGHDGFLGKVLKSWTAAMADETPEERRGASALAATSERVTKSELKRSASSDIMSAEQMETLREALPAMCRMREWTLTYSTKRDGISLKSLYRRSSGKENTVLVVSDSGGAIFGAFCTEAWKLHSRYVGTGESFVFSLAPEGMKYAWSGENDYFMLGAADSLSVGGGSAHAIRLEEDLLQGSSGECETFDSPPLASSDMFRVSRIELWSLD
ncbi:TLD-domain-containing protein [Ostreococcus tauri]|uniref:Oxidation resistance protein 1 n=1 Tax=Ostreococcus tauri TaxID=70448 RepID=A0A1Y5I5S8_OSTTA|nr:TLD-domain-containing protein [Ostreococcus tauri]